MNPGRRVAFAPTHLGPIRVETRQGEPIECARPVPQPGFRQGTVVCVGRLGESPSQHLLRVAKANGWAFEYLDTNHVWIGLGPGAFSEFFQGFRDFQVCASEPREFRRGRCPACPAFPWATQPSDSDWPGYLLA